MRRGLGAYEDVFYVLDALLSDDVFYVLDGLLSDDVVEELVEPVLSSLLDEDDEDDEDDDLSLLADVEVEDFEVGFLRLSFL